MEFQLDWNNLAGKVLIYSRLAEDPDEAFYKAFCVYLSNDREDIRNVMLSVGVPEEIVDMSIERNLMDLEKKLRPYKQLGLMGERTTTLYQFVPSMSLEGKIDEDADEINLGEHSNPNICKALINLIVSSYILSYLDQQKLRKEGAAELTHEEFIHEGKRESIMPHIRDTYLRPMIAAKKTDDSSTYLSLRKDFFRFAQGSEFENVVLDLNGCFDEGGCHPYTDRVTSFCMLMNAIHTERYESAEEILADILQKKETTH